MNKLASDLEPWRKSKGIEGAMLAVCPPATLLQKTCEILRDSPICVGGQDCHYEESGAHTGDVSAAMIADCGAEFSIAGHSERRQNHRETNEMVADKANACWDNKMAVVVCIGESEQEYENGETQKILRTQIKGSLPEKTNEKIGEIIVAYEPVWAIGTGKTPSVGEIEQTHRFIRGEIVDRFGDAAKEIPLLYGGSVKPDNASEIINTENVNGALVGGASLKIEDFEGIAKAALSV